MVGALRCAYLSIARCVKGIQMRKNMAFHSRRCGRWSFIYPARELGSDLASYRVANFGDHVAMSVYL
jgi:hypothetical protein